MIKLLDDVYFSFYLQLFSNGMMESEQRHVTLRINASGMCNYLSCASEVGSLYRNCKIIGLVIFRSMLGA